jgi:Dolichyl-phosphate-mannose-protein mannosyltransferase
MVRAGTLPAFAWRPVAAAAAVVAVVLTLTSTAYGYHRDELYFRMLEPAWGYLDQPPLTPWLARTLTGLFGDTLLVMRVPATLSLVAAIVIVALLARELGGRAGAQSLAAWGYGTAATPLIFGHTFLTASVDMVVWPAVLWLVTRALLRDSRWWLAAGAVAGLGLYNKLLVVVLLGAVAVGILLAGPRRVLTTPWPWGGAAAALVVGLPNVVYQVLNGWPQLEMGGALGENNAADVRVDMWLFQLLTLGPPLAVVWIVGAVGLWRRPAWRRLRGLVAAYPVILAFVFVGGSQVYYASGLIAAFYAAGCVVVAEWARTAWRRAAVVALVAVNALGSAVIALPLIPVDDVGATPVPDINQTAADAVGWPTYVHQVEDAVAALPASDRARAIVLTSNYGEAGALVRFGDDLPPVFSGHNALHSQGLPPATASVAVVLDESAAGPAALFATCEAVGRLDNGVDVDNEEQGVRILVCRDPVGGWESVWPQVRHLD